MRVEVHRAIDALPDDYREAVILHHLEGYTIAQSAALLACPSGTVAARVSRGRQVLRERLGRRGAALPAAALVALLASERRSSSALAMASSNRRSAEATGAGRPARWVPLRLPPDPRPPLFLPGSVAALGAGWWWKYPAAAMFLGAPAAVLFAAHFGEPTTIQTTTETSRVVVHAGHSGGDRRETD